MVKRLKRLLVGTLAAAMLVSGFGGAGGMREVKAAEAAGKNEFGVSLPEGYYNRKVVGYFPNYAINSEAHKYFDITQLQWDKLTHVQYAFATVDAGSMKIVPSDPENDVENRFEDREFYHKGEKIEMDSTLGYYGQFNLMHTMKKKYPDVTVLVSTGGWAASRNLWLVMDNEDNMKTFADSAVDFIRKYGFDGIDIDFEYPSETAQSGNTADADISEPRRKGISDRYTRFMEIMGEKLAAASKADGKYYWLTSAVTASSWVLGGQTNSRFLDYLDFVSIMSYDYHGGWNRYVENQANIYADPADTETSSLALPTLGFDWSMNYYRGAVQSEKILMGVPYYTRGWTNVQGGVNGLHGSSNTPASGEENIWGDLDANGKEEPAGANPLWHVLNLMQKDSNYKKYWDPAGRVPHVWNDVTKTFLTFEDEQSIQERINVVKEKNLGGVLIWVMHGDYDYDEASQEYTVGDTLTTMLYDQLTKAGAASITSDIDLDVEVADYDVEFTGKYDHPNYYYTINVTNHTGESLNAFTLSFDLPRSAIFQSSYGGGNPVITDAKDPAFKTVTLTAPGWQTLNDGETMKMEGAIKLNFAGVKNFKLNGMAMKSEVEAERERLIRLGKDVPEMVLAVPQKAAQEPEENGEKTADEEGLKTEGIADGEITGDVQEEKTDKDETAVPETPSDKEQDASNAEDGADDKNTEEGSGMEENENTEKDAGTEVTPGAEEVPETEGASGTEEIPETEEMPGTESIPETQAASGTDVAAGE